MVKTISNYYAGALDNRFGRKNLLVLGWIFAILIPFSFFMLKAGTGLLLTMFCWELTMNNTVVINIELEEKKDRGFAMGLNEFASFDKEPCFNEGRFSTGNNFA